MAAARSNLLRILRKRLLLAVPLLLTVSLAGFLVMHAAPGDPLARLVLNPNVRAEDIENLRRAWGLDRPLPEQYLRWLVAYLTGDWGVSLQSGVPVKELVSAALPRSLILIGAAFSMALPASILYGVCTYHRQHVLIRLMQASSHVFLAMPTFVIGLLLIHVFAERLRWLPSAGMYNPRYEPNLIDLLLHLLMPAITLALPLMAGWGQVFRAVLQKAASEPHVWGARSRGLPPGQVLWRHIMRNAWSPFFTLTALDVPSLLTGSVIVETLFAWPGLGQLYVQAAAGRDYPLLMAIIMLVALVTVLSNTLADMAGCSLDPRLVDPDVCGRKLQ